MKKILSLLMIFTLSLSLISCGGKKDNTSKEGSEGSEKISVDEKLLNVDITLPKSLFSEENMENFNADNYAKENGYKKAVLNEDSSLTVTMSKSEHKELLDKTAKEVNKSLNDMIEGENTPYIKAVTSSKDFDSVTIDVDRAVYESSFDLTPFVVGVTVMFYQALSNVEYKCEIIMRDFETQETITSVIYPDALNQ